MARHDIERGRGRSSGRGRGGRGRGRGGRMSGGHRAPSPAPSHDHNQQRRKKPRGAGRQQHYNVDRASSTAPSAAFLAALEEQRENERRREALEQQVSVAADAAQPSIDSANTPSTSARIPEPKPAAAPIAGFYFDDTQRRYFKLTPQTAQRLAHEKKQRVACEHDAAARSTLQARRAAQHSTRNSSNSRGSCRLTLLQDTAGEPSSSWLAYLLARESSSSAWSTAHCHTQTVTERVVGTHMARSSLRQVRTQMTWPRDRITALSFRGATGVGAIARDGGGVDVFRVDYEHDTRFGDAKRGERSLTVVERSSAGMSTQVTALQWQPPDALGSASNFVLCASVGGDAPASATGHTGILSLYRVGDRLESTVGPSALERQWRFRDPWTITWSTAAPGRFAVGLSGPECAAVVDTAVLSSVTRAPPGKVKSDVMAQAFTHDGRTIVNGTRSGTAWLWDLRARRRAYEQIVVPASKRDQLNHGAAIVDLYALRDDVQVVVLQSDGALQLLDMRTFKPVVEFAPGQMHAYMPRLKCAVDASECVVVAPASRNSERDASAVSSYSIRSGRVVSRVAVDTSTCEDRAMSLPLEQVHLIEPRDGCMEVWALGRSALFATTPCADVDA